MIYLLGGSGYVGQAYQRLFEWQKIPYKVINRKDCDYSNTQILIEALQQDRPEFLINAAGYTGKPNVDACEKEKAECLFGNAILPKRIADACEATNIPWGHVSSGCIYTGSRPDGSGFTELDEPNFTFRQNNCSFYSGSKALGEEILKDCKNVYIWRLRIPFDNKNNPRNYLTKLMTYDKLLDATNSISHLDQFCHATFSCWLKHIPFGIYNVVNPEPITTNIVVYLIKKWKICNKKFEFFRDEEEFLKIAAKTPRSNCVLDPSKLISTGILLPRSDYAVEKCLQFWNE